MARRSALGMLMAADLSRRLGQIDAAAVQRVRALLQRAGLPVRGAARSAPRARSSCMRIDKKVQAGRMRLVLLAALGRAVRERRLPGRATRSRRWRRWFGDGDAGRVAAR